MVEATMPIGVYKRTKPPWNKGKKTGKTSPLLTKTKKKISESHKGEKAYNWKGDNAKNAAIHNWVYREKGRPQVCEDCGATSKERKLHWANKDHKYRRKLDDYISRCSSCHKKYDIINN